MEYLEQEIKFYIEDLDRLIARAQATGADLIRPRVLERNLRLDTPEGDFLRDSRVLRIRQDDGVRVTYKDNAHNENGMVVRTEIEFSTDNLEVTRKFFEALGYQVIVIYEKYRQVYDLDGVSVTLDEMPYGDFVEIEGPDTEGIRKVNNLLELDWDARIMESYVVLFNRINRELALGLRDLIFENFTGVDVSLEALNLKPADL